MTVLFLAPRLVPIEIDFDFCCEQVEKHFVAMALPVLVHL